MPNNLFKTRGPVVKLDRSQKARMIESFLQDALPSGISGFRILDVGCGNGMISQYFSKNNDVTGVDIVDQRRKDMQSFNFIQVHSAQLPFEDASFDIVISHHVIEHVPDQKAHLSELHRVLKMEGLGYLGTPNKSSPVMEGHVGNDLVLQYSQMVPLMQSQGFKTELISLRLASRPDRYYGDIRFGKFIPEFALRRLIPYFPSHYFLLRKKDHDV